MIQVTIVEVKPEKKAPTVAKVGDAFKSKLGILYIISSRGYLTVSGGQLLGEMAFAEHLTHFTDPKNEYEYAGTAKFIVELEKAA
jgi:hypothetical protein